MEFQYNLFVVFGFFLISAFVLNSLIRGYIASLKKTIITFSIPNEESSENSSEDYIIDDDEDDEDDDEYYRNINKELFKRFK